MISLLRKELASFFSTLTGYLVIIVYLLANSLFLWVFPGTFNIAENGYASLNALFVISPWVFLFLVSAVTMRTFSDEKRQGTLELLLTKPLSELQIILAKYFAAVILVLLSLLPTMVFFISVYFLGNPVGNIDTGGTWGSFIGLFFLAVSYAAIGVFASSITDNPIVAFIAAMCISALFFIGFDFLSSVSLFAGIEGLITNLGINEHYKSLSRGVIDSRDIVYFIGLSAVFLMLTRMVLQKRKW